MCSAQTVPFKLQWLCFTSWSLFSSQNANTRQYLQVIEYPTVRWLLFTCYICTQVNFNHQTRWKHNSKIDKSGWSEKSFRSRPIFHYHMHEFSAKREAQQEWLCKSHLCPAVSFGSVPSNVEAFSFRCLLRFRGPFLYSGVTLPSMDQNVLWKAEATGTKDGLQIKNLVRGSEFWFY